MGVRLFNTWMLMVMVVITFIHVIPSIWLVSLPINRYMYVRIHLNMSWYIQLTRSVIMICTRTQYGSVWFWAIFSPAPCSLVFLKHSRHLTLIICHYAVQYDLVSARLGQILKKIWTNLGQSKCFFFFILSLYKAAQQVFFFERGPTGF